MIRAVISVVAALLPIAGAIFFLEATSQPEDANIGGGLLLFVSIPVGIALGALLYKKLKSDKEAH